MNMTDNKIIDFSTITCEPDSTQYISVVLDREKIKQEILDLFARYGSGDYQPTDSELGVISETLDELFSVLSPIPPWRPVTYEMDDKGNILLPDGPPFDGNPVLIQTRTGIVEAWWCPIEKTHSVYFDVDEWDGFYWVCYDDQFHEELDNALKWCPLEKNNG